MIYAILTAIFLTILIGLCVLALFECFQNYEDYAILYYEDYAILFGMLLILIIGSVLNLHWYYQSVITELQTSLMVESDDLDCYCYCAETTEQILE